MTTPRSGLLAAALVAGTVGLVAATCRGVDSPPHEAREHPESVEPAIQLTRSEAPADLGERAFEHVAKLVSFGPRYPGSDGHARAIDYMQTHLREAGLTPVLERWTEADEDLELCNVRARIPGVRSERIVIGCHHDTKRTDGHPEPTHNFEFVGANDSGSGVGLLLELARTLAARAEDNPLPVTVEVVFFDGEESVPFHWDIDRALFGSRRFVRGYREARMLGSSGDGSRILSMVLLDLVGSRDLQIDDDELSDPRLQAIVLQAATLHGHESVFFQTHTRVTDDHVPFLDEGIPSVDLIDIADNPQWHEPTDTLEHLAPESLQIVGEVVLTALPGIAERFLPDDSRLDVGGEGR